jgi:hypothetical protein
MKARNWKTAHAECLWRWDLPLRAIFAPVPPAVLSLFHSLYRVAIGAEHLVFSHVGLHALKNAPIIGETIYQLLALPTAATVYVVALQGPYIGVIAAAHTLPAKQIEYLVAQCSALRIQATFSTGWFLLAVRASVLAATRYLLVVMPGNTSGDTPGSVAERGLCSVRGTHRGTLSPALCAWRDTRSCAGGNARCGVRARPYY